MLECTVYWGHFVVMQFWCTRGERRQGKKNDANFLFPSSFKFWFCTDRLWNFYSYRYRILDKAFVGLRFLRVVCTRAQILCLSIDIRFGTLFLSDERRHSCSDCFPTWNYMGGFNFDSWIFRKVQGKAYPKHFCTVDCPPVCFMNDVKTAKERRAVIGWQSIAAQCRSNAC